MPIMKRCNTCHQLYEGKHCRPCHNKRAKAFDRERYEAKQVYNSRRWRKCRDNIIIKFAGLDIWLLAEDIISKPTKLYIHHIQERDEAPALIYDIDNLIPVSRESHDQIHEAYKVNKQEAIARIKQGIAKYYDMFPNN